MKTSIFRVTYGLVLLAASILFAGKISADQTNLATQHEHEGKGVITQDERAARAADIALLAKESGLPIESVERSITFQEAFSKYADDLLERYPNQISTIWVEPVPGARGHIKFVDAVPTDVTPELAQNDALTPNNVLLEGYGKISMEEHTRRAELSARALKDLDYRNYVTFFDSKREVIRIELKLPDGVLQPDKAGIADAMRERMQMENVNDAEPLRGSAVAVEESDLDLTIFSGDEPIVMLAHSRGGNWLRDDGVRECTSGWSVSGPNGDGIITAGHCHGLNQFEEPGVAPYAMTWRDEEYGLLGDVEYHTTSHVEYDDFYADSVDIRDVTGIKTTATMVGSAVCVYGRQSDVRTCNHEVETTNATVVDDNGVTVGKLARTSGDVSIMKGDSGGGWSVGNTAWGVTHGYSNPISLDNSYFTPVQQAQTVLGITIKK